MSDRLRADFWVSAYLRRCAVEGLVAVLRRRGSAEAGAIMVKLDRLDGTATLFAPAPQSAVADAGSDRRFIRAHTALAIGAGDVEERLKREVRFDQDLWIVEVEDRLGRHWLDLVDPAAPA